MTYPEIQLAQSIIQICKANNLKHIIISPGSRNAPLTIGFASDPFFMCYSIADERCAAFFAMGIAQQTNEPTAIVCTSGSALLNYYPAVAEAFYSEIPLVVISADRPSYKIDIGDGQTIRQKDVYANHILLSANLTEQASLVNDTLINKAIHTAKAKRGPVHINAPFEEPLYNTVEQLTTTPQIATYQEKNIEAIDYDHYVNQWNQAQKKLILVGVNTPHSLSQIILERLASDPSVVVLTETTSNLHHPKFIEHIDRVITTFSEEDFKAFAPDILITFGGMVVSKRIKACLRKYKPSEHWHIDLQRHYDTFDALSHKIIDTPARFFQSLLERVSLTPSKYQSWAYSIAKQRQEKHLAYMQQIPYSDLQVFECLMQTLPKNSQLQISNSSAIRYAQLVPIDPSIVVFCNRGTSGIDGSTSTAIGAAVGSDRPTVLITGDISFLYDSNALWNAYTPTNFKIILLNNKGGGIFRILPGHKQTPVFNTYFETTHQLTAQHLAKMYNYAYTTVDNLADLKSVLPSFWSQNKKPSILEISTPTEVNDQVLRNYFRNM
ncbi:2-succinyl-5-enolpyruvyl-6-hydroxy-3-cyclohexene-1-carboxylic-acid synthase [Myroides pelagicus]|uniref:2-succinyl-5-enolpyruvyl-6-hydroxy-3- cyclohexene-1-carboxylic-acid synthase n=1 Tax=Myroides pelagicus TaxID=270914 RepID=UPI002DBD8DCE|nr:2-succinyl-5-enolpyruvyl-6-hydroxy-3-cyclohexene-1-carboxylic-acid synthase [Myroides pelagicus]MEC4114180.1 2-succinyl-5-enolpyruvyl-6-hydroxy-3-cyclohexene-1-carboxylic-acid synthase [Myroides pelagicus]